MSQQYETGPSLAQPWRFFSGSGGLLVLVCFFLPFMTVSCGGVPVLNEASAYELAQGPAVPGQAGEPNPILWFIFIGGALGFLSAAIPKPMQQVGGVTTLVSMLFVIVPLFLYYVNTRSDVPEGVPIEISWEVGFWGLLLGLVLLGVGGILALLSPQQAPYAGSPQGGFAGVPPQLSSRPHDLPPSRAVNFSPLPQTAPPPSQKYSDRGSSTNTGYDDYPATGLNTEPSSGTRVSSSTVDNHRVNPLDKGSPTPKAWLVPLNKSSKQYSLMSKTIIGRDRRRAQIVLNDPRSSSEHACIRYEDGHFVLHDLASTNGTYWNGRRIDSPTPLADGDHLRFGRSELMFKEVHS